MTANIDLEQEPDKIKQDIRALEALVGLVEKMISNKRLELNNAILNASGLYYGEYLIATETYHKWASENRPVTYEDDTVRLEIRAIYNWDNKMAEVRMRQYCDTGGSTLEIYIPLDIAMEIVDEQE